MSQYDKTSLRYESVSRYCVELKVAGNISALVATTTKEKGSRMRRVNPGCQFKIARANLYRGKVLKFHIGS